MTISDQGAGLDPNHLNQVFDELNEQDIEHHTDGHKLSLAIARQITLAHEGKIEVASQNGAGTIFMVHLPLVER